MKRAVLFTVATFLLIALAATNLLRDRSGFAQDAKLAVPQVAQPRSGALLGSNSCSASVCHGGSDLGKPFSEATTWRAHDPHTCAYETLLTPLSQNIARHLWGDRRSAHEEPLCLKCHVHPEYANASSTFRKQDGVGCESCHGPAHDWVGAHYREAWQSLALKDKRAKGLADTQSLPGRAEICARCHVGTPDASVDHDLIAAGHPPLRFEFATYLANLPAHWEVGKDKGRHREGEGITRTEYFHASAWTIGRQVSARIALELLAHRADPANGKPWPEFAEMDCFACHHDLGGPNERQKKAHLVDRRPGSVPWSRTHYPPFDSSDDFRPAAKSRQDLTRESRNVTAKLQTVAEDTRRQFLHLVALETSATGHEPSNWDDAVFRYFAGMAMRDYLNENQRGPDAALDRRIVELRKQIGFEKGQQGPQGIWPRYVEYSGAPQGPSGGKK